MAEIIDGRQSKRRGRPPGAMNKITQDIRAALRDLAEGNADRVQSWLDSVAESDPAEALRLWLALLRYVTPTLQAAAIADLTPKSIRERVTSMTDEELMEVIVNSQEAAELVKQGVKTKGGTAARHNSGRQNKSASRTDGGTALAQDQSLPSRRR